MGVEITPGSVNRAAYPCTRIVLAPSPRLTARSEASQSSEANQTGGLLHVEMMEQESFGLTDGYRNFHSVLIGLRSSSG